MQNIKILDRSQWENPQLFPRAKGKLWWQTMTSLEESRGLRESVLEAPSQLVKKQNDFIQRNIHQLTVELDAIRSGTQKNKHAKDEQLSISGAPIDRKAWMEWFSWPENENQFMQHSVNCRNGIRKVHNHRLE